MKHRLKYLEQGNNFTRSTEITYVMPVNYFLYNTQSPGFILN